MICTGQFHKDDGDNYITGFVCDDCDEQRRERVVPIAELRAALGSTPVVVLDDRRFVCADYSGECQSEDWHGCNDCVHHPGV